MEFFNHVKGAVRLRNHLNKYLVADEDETTVRQSRNGSSNKAWWTVEFVDGKSHVIRLKSCYGKYLTPSQEPFLLGMTGKKMVQDIMATKRDTSAEWEPIKENGFVKLRGKGGKFLRHNWGTPPWRNTVTFDVPNRTATQSWVLWEVDVVDVSVLESRGSAPLNSYVSPASSFSSLPDDWSGADSRHSLSMMASNGSAAYASGRQSGMDFFHRAKAVRLQSHHGKYLIACEDEETVRQSHDGSSKQACWTVEYAEGKSNTIRLKSCYGLYLKATNEQFLTGMTGKRVQQILHAHTKMDSTMEWEPIKEGAFHVKLRTVEGKFLRANGGIPPWRNSVTHDVPHRTATQDWVLWSVDIVDISISSLETTTSVVSSFSSSTDDFDGSPVAAAVSTRSGHYASTALVDDSNHGSPVKSEGRTIYYSVVDDDGSTNDGIEERSFTFKGHGLEELSQKLEDETGLDDIIVCSRNPLNKKLYPLRLSLPPNNAAMHIVLVPSTSKVASDFLPCS